MKKVVAPAAKKPDSSSSEDDSDDEVCSLLWDLQYRYYFIWFALLFEFSN